MAATGVSMAATGVPMATMRVYRTQRPFYKLCHTFLARNGAGWSWDHTADCLVASMSTSHVCILHIPGRTLNGQLWLLPTAPGENAHCAGQRPLSTLALFGTFFHAAHT